jgi:hypothetical protein
VARRLDASGSGAWMSAIWRMGVTSRVRTAGRMEGVREVLAWGQACRALRYRGGRHALRWPVTYAFNSMLRERWSSGGATAVSAL